jgi:hypothetical protein
MGVIQPLINTLPPQPFAAASVQVRPQRRLLPLPLLQPREADSAEDARVGAQDLCRTRRTRSLRRRRCQDCRSRRTRLSASFPEISAKNKNHEEVREEKYFEWFSGELSDFLSDLGRRLVLSVIEGWWPREEVEIS